MVSIQVDRIDGLSSATAMKGPCRAATTANIALYGEKTIDGVAVVTGNRVLVKDQAAPYENGIYVVDTGQWRRAKDFYRTNDVVKGTQVAITDGTVSGGYLYSLVTNNPISVGTTSISFEIAGTVLAAQAFAEQAEAAAAEAADYAALAFNSKAVRSFIGDGSTVAFDLTIDPGNLNNTTVFVSGLYQDKNRYSLSGTVITFSEPPPAPDVPGDPNIEVELGNRVDVGTPADRSVTYAKMQAVASARILGRLSAGAGDTQELTIEQARAAIGATRPCFVANKGGTNQTGVASVTETKVTFGTEVTDVGGYYNTSTSRWTPPAGPVHMSAALFFSGALVSGGTSYVVIYKNGAPFRAGAGQNGANTGVSAGFVSAIDVASGTDYYEVFGFTTTSSGTATISGGTTASRFEGYSL